MKQKSQEWEKAVRRSKERLEGKQKKIQGVKFTGSQKL